MLRRTNDGKPPEEGKRKVDCNNVLKTFVALTRISYVVTSLKTRAKLAEFENFVDEHPEFFDEELELSQNALEKIIDIVEQYL